MTRLVFILLALVLIPAGLQAQTATLKIEVRRGAEAVPGASVAVNGEAHVTDSSGRASVTVAAGSIELAIAKEGYLPAAATIVVAAGEQRDVVVELQSARAVEEEITVSATRTGRRLEDQPMHVEVLGREEIDEKLFMTPGDIVMMLNEVGGLRVQATSPALGAASVRIQGMRGRYTRFLSDGLPLFGEQVGALGLLQIPPMDLGQVELIKGVASSLYGAGAMGGVVNLISRRPGKEPEHEALVNRSALGATDTLFWHAAPLSSTWGLTMLGGGHWQRQTDLDDDTWADLPGFSRGVFRPRVFWNGDNGRSFFATAGVTVEDRTGGTLPGEVLPESGAPNVEAVHTTRVDAGAVGQMLFGDRFLATWRFAVAQQRHDHQFGEIRERDRHDTIFGEAAVRAARGRHTWVAGVALEREAYHPRDVPRFAYSFAIPGVFVQDDIDVRRWLSVSASGRVDHHSQYGTFFSPRVSALIRSGRWISRASFGTGFFGPTPLTEETEAAGLSRLSIPDRLLAEEGRNASAEIGRTDGPLTYALTLFASEVRHPIDVDRDPALILVNAAEPTTTSGVEWLATVRRAPFSLTGTYTYVRPREQEGGVRLDVPLTPRHSAAIVAMWERERIGRLGVEWYYTGTQRLDDNPYRDVSSAYTIFGLLAERRFGRVRVFINGENLGGVRQSRWDPLIRKSRAADGRWTVDAWAPLDGRIVNGGVRIGW